MKELYLIRHAKSSWNELGLSDFDRPLNKRGQRDAPFMGSILKEKGTLPDLIISSPAKRAITTAKIIADEIGYKKDKIKTNEDLYLASSSTFLNILKRIDKKLDKIFMFSHNPGITMFAEVLTNNYIGNIPTCGIYRISFDIKSWKDVKGGIGTMVSFDYPKKYIQN